MAKKKSKTQKYKKNLKKKMNKATKVEPKTENKPIKEKQLLEKDKVKYNVPLTESNVAKKNSANVKKNNGNTNKKSSNSNYNKNKCSTNKKKQLVEKSKVKYNLPLTEPESLKKKSDSTKKALDNKEKTKPLNPEINKQVSAKVEKKPKNIAEKKKVKDENKIKVVLKDGLNKLKQLSDNLKKGLKTRKNKKAKDEIVLPKKASTVKKEFEKNNKISNNQKKNVFVRLIYEVGTNIHILFNTVLIMFFIVLLIGMIRIEVLSTGTIVYISLIILFLSLIALSYTKYISGKIFTVVLCAGMGFAIYRMQYTYDFVRNLASNVYEYKTYYVVTFDNGLNKSIYTINNKSVGLLKDNCINIERRLNTKLDDVNYLEYEDINLLFEDFYDSKYRAILVNENQYKYLQNNIQGQKAVKILYEFKVNEKK